jgi:hypothetical protein
VELIVDSRTLLALVAAHEGDPYKLAAEVAAAQKEQDAAISLELDPSGAVAGAIRGAS